MTFSEYRPVFDGNFPSETSVRWSLIRDFIQAWHKVQFTQLTESRRQNAIVELEDSMGCPLSPSIREWAFLCWDLEDLSSWDLVFRDYMSMQMFCATHSDSVNRDKLTALSLMNQAEGDYHWAVLSQRVSDIDPPTAGFHLDFESEKDDSFIYDRQWSSSVSGWALKHILTYLHISAPGGFFTTNLTDTDKLYELRDWASFEFEELRVLEAPDMVITVGPAWGNWKTQMLSVHLWKEAPLPDFLLPYMRRSHYYSQSLEAYK